ncbi:hypothetical protein MUN82_08655 [Hymenobacter aerilatus]|uniref:Uncharacterized protein n=1 Tax=Hymenobacter aerilatus TaxID=2932251 RepID=A0A8T9T2G2_9BACT|nr:hypothetical protein [Hymenobacter aerilatus]UOR07153.1 hypothetical protein MUN82_08655 [Hymenobacter aerilatus]
MALLTTLADNDYQSLSPVQEAGNLSFLLAEYERRYGVVEPPVDPPTTQAPTVDASTGQFTAPSGISYTVSYS